jgi:hypothetical protein
MRADVIGVDLPFPRPAFRTGKQEGQAVGAKPLPPEDYAPLLNPIRRLHTENGKRGPLAALRTMSEPGSRP